jgi:hypothetical protein
MSPTPTDASALRSQLRILEASNAFRESARHRSLLAFLLETTLKGGADTLKEFTIAAEVWGRDVSFDPRIHSMVRVEIGRLRTRLERYYAGEGADSLVRFSIPVGGYRVVWDGNHSAVEAAERASPSCWPKCQKHFRFLDRRLEQDLGQ